MQIVAPKQIFLGDMKMLESKQAEYPWALDRNSFIRVDWLKEFRSKLRWEKDSHGRDALVYPK